MKFNFKDKQGNIIGAGEGENPTQAAKAAGIGEYFEAKDVSDPASAADSALGRTEAGESTHETSAAEKKPRKPRADAGVKRGAWGHSVKTPEKPAKKGRSRGQFYVFAAGALSGPFGHQGLNDTLDSQELEVRNNARVIQGRELKAERKVQFTLKGI